MVEHQAVSGAGAPATPPMSPRVDLHTHSDCSDGVLSPAALIARAAVRQVHALALTDHDTLSGCEAARAACHANGIQFLPGVELSAEWRGREIHVVGLNVDPADPALQHHCGAMLERRRERLGAIAQRLCAAGLPGEALIRTALAADAPTRTHVAQAMCHAGIAKDAATAFERWLKRGRPGHVAARW
jgi:hypothetical protein